MNHPSRSLRSFALLCGVIVSCSAPVGSGEDDTGAGQAGGTGSTGMTDGGGTGGLASGGFGSAPVGGSSDGGGSVGGGSVGGSAVGGDSSGGAEGGGGASIGGSGGESVGGSGGQPQTGGDPNFHLFLLLGQSNMDGKPTPEPSDLVENERVEVLAYDNCPNLGRVEGKWYPATPPLHNCYAGLSLADSFGKKVIRSLPDEVRVGLIPCAVNSADIDLFRKGIVSSRRDEFYIPPDDSRPGAYDWIVERAQQAQEVGVIRGILFHHGESNAGQQVWAEHVAEIVADLRADLNLGNIPFLAGELLQDTNQVNACCESHNPIIGRLPDLIDNAHVISSAGLDATDSAHFGLAGTRTFGERYAQKYLDISAP